MAYEQLSDVQTVQLGGFNKESGKPNPSQIEGYLLRIEQRDPGKYPKIDKATGKPKPQLYYVLQTAKGDLGFYGKTDIDRKLKGATLGAMTLVRATNETKDTGMGNPMKIWYVAQDKSNVIDTGVDSSTYESASLEEPEGEDFSYDEAPAYTPPAKGNTAPPNAARVAQMNALLAKSRPKTA